jgi:hypothetical protein
MAGKDSSPWPDFGKPATKGDVMLALVGIRSNTIHTRIALAASVSGDNGTVLAMLEKLEADDEDLQAMINKFGGKIDG